MSGGADMAELSAEQLARLKEMLGLASLEEAGFVAAEVWGALVIHDMVAEARQRTEEFEQAHARLESIRSAAKRLSSLLAQEPIAGTLLSPRETFSGAIDMSEVLERREQQAASLQHQLAVLLLNAEELLQSRDQHRAVRMLPTAANAELSSVSLTLWPILFRVWTRHRQKLGKTEDGPLHRFVIFIHEIAGLQEPRWGALRYAINRHLQHTDSAPDDDVATRLN
jgi:hypothetical protein